MMRATAYLEISKESAGTTQAYRDLDLLLVNNIDEYSMEHIMYFDPCIVMAI